MHYKTKRIQSLFLAILLIFQILCPHKVDSYTCNLSSAQCLAEHQNTIQSAQYVLDCYENGDEPDKSFDCASRCRTGNFHACSQLCLQKGFEDHGVYCDRTTSTPTSTPTTSTTSTSRSSTTRLSRRTTQWKAIVDMLRSNKAPLMITKPTSSIQGANQTGTKFIVICVSLVCVSAVCAVMTGLYVKLRKKNYTQPPSDETDNEGTPDGNADTSANSQV